MPVALKIKFGIRAILIGVAIYAVIITFGAWATRKWSTADFVVQEVQSLNGAVGVNYPPDEVYFSVPGRPPLVTDAHLRKIARYLGELKIRTIGLTNANVGDSGLRSVISECRATLQRLDVSGTDVIGKSFDELSASADLQVLILSDLQLSQASIDAIAKVKSLREIIIFGMRPGDSRLTWLKEALRNDVIVEVR